MMMMIIWKKNKFEIWITKQQPTILFNYDFFKKKNEENSYLIFWNEKKKEGNSSKLLDSICDLCECFCCFLILKIPMKNFLGMMNIYMFVFFGDLVF